LLEVVCLPGGVVLVLEDMHWADGGSIELCEYLLRHPPRCQLALAVSYRPRQVDARLSAALDAAADRGNAAVAELGPLSFDEATELMPPELGRSARHRMYLTSGGNPLYLETLARQHAASGLVVEGASADGQPPVRAVLAAEFVALSPTERVVLDAAAVV